MRIILAAAALLALAACGRADDPAVRSQIRADGIAGCRTSYRAGLEGRWTDELAPAVDRLCGCIIDRTMDGRSNYEMRAWVTRTERTPEENAERDRIFRQCSAEHEDEIVAILNRRPADARQSDLDSVRGEAADSAAAVPGVRARARANLSSYVSADDYPASALRNDEQGRTAFELVISAQGRVSDCIIRESSGSAALDSATCRIMRSRARFTPARDAAGDPAPDRQRHAITWRLED